MCNANLRCTLIDMNDQKKSIMQKWRITKELNDDEVG